VQLTDGQRNHVLRVFERHRLPPTYSGHTHTTHHTPTMLLRTCIQRTGSLWATTTASIRTTTALVNGARRRAAYSTAVEKSDEGEVSYLRDPECAREVFLIGTAHVSRKSADSVRKLIREVKPGKLCVGGVCWECALCAVGVWMCFVVCVCVCVCVSINALLSLPILQSLLPTRTPKTTCSWSWTRSVDGAS
jgi:hypothetical protein